MPKRGQDPEHDALEKALLKTATRGVVRLFNAVSKAQRDQKDALVGGSRPRVRLSDLLMIILICTTTFETACVDVLAFVVMLSPQRAVSPCAHHFCNYVWHILLSMHVGSWGCTQVQHGYDDFHQA